MAERYVLGSFMVKLATALDEFWDLLQTMRKQLIGAPDTVQAGIAPTARQLHAVERVIF